MAVPRSRRDLGVTALIEGFFASAWFGWGQAEPSRLGAVLGVGSVPALLVAVAGAVAASLVTGLGAGCLLLIFGAIVLVWALRGPWSSI
jgi:hypothetical protein